MPINHRAGRSTTNPVGILGALITHDPAWPQEPGKLWRRTGSRFLSPLNPAGGHPPKAGTKSSREFWKNIFKDTGVIVFFFACLLASAPVLAEPAATLETAAAAISSQTDPAKLKTLKSPRAANPRLFRSVYWLAAGRAAGLDPEAILAKAAELNKTAGSPRAEFVRWGLVENLRLADDLGLLGLDGLAELRRGKSPTITRGPDVGEEAQADHLVPRSVCPELENEVFNLEFLAASKNRMKSDKVTARAKKFAAELRAAGLLSEAGWAAVESRASAVK